MATTPILQRTGSRLLVALLATAILLGAVQSASAQYQYVPSPDYYHNDTAGGTVLGGALGAITGAIVGGKSKRGEGALIGAGVGAITGNVLGRNKDRADQYRAATGAATVARANQAVAAQAVTNYDLIRMTQAGVTEEVIISALRSRGARLDLSPEGLIALKENGVSDRVLINAQNLAQNYAAAPGPTIVTEAVPPTVIVAPRPVYHYGYWPHYYHRPCYHHHHYGHGPRVSVRF